ncbi:MAG TPA: cytochrome c-type biogenesis protein [Aliidongia sp.]|nr:cytochrome c-type biogenesis protein [Aliidongia sp.]
MRRALLALLLLALPVAAGAVNPNERLADPALEARARQLSQGLRCLVCQNQSIDDSNADLAHDLRVLVRERLTAGDSDEQVLQYLRARYGDYVLLSPPVERVTLLLWFGPAAALLIAVGAVILATRRRRETPLPPLDPAERARLDALLKSDGR